MKIELLHGWANEDGCFASGTVVDVSPAQARSMVGRNYARPVEPFPVEVVETAAIDHAGDERAVSRKAIK
jgi:hypothetical protein